jgi:hypothetical protein
MAERVIYRGRPRADKPYPFQVDVDALPETYFTGLLGPLTLDELMEIKFRVKKFKVTGSVETKPPLLNVEAPSEPQTVSFDYELEKGRQLLIIGPNGMTSTFKREAYTKESESTTDFIISSPQFFEHTFIKILELDSLGVSQLNISRYLNFRSTFKTNAGYYLPFSLELYYQEDIDTRPVSIRNKNHGATEPQPPPVGIGPILNFVYFDCQLKIRSKTHSIRCVTAGAISASLTIEATEWWPYANADGQPIWNTADGTRTSNPFT